MTRPGDGAWERAVGGGTTMIEEEVLDSARRRSGPQRNPGSKGPAESRGTPLPAGAASSSKTDGTCVPEESAPATTEKPKKKRKQPAPLRMKTLLWLRAREWVGDSVERKNRFISYDYMGFADLLMVRRDRADDATVVLGVQVCHSERRAEHEEKLCHGDGADGCRKFLGEGGKTKIAIIAWDTRKEWAGHFKRGVGQRTWKITSVEWVVRGEGESLSLIPGEEAEFA